jgi:hypothetical protein
MHKAIAMPMQEIRRHQVYRLQRNSKRSILARLRRALRIARPR